MRHFRLLDLEARAFLKEMEPGSIADWFAGGSTFLAVLVALFKDDILRYWRRPELAASISLAPPDCDKTTMLGRGRNPAETYCLRLQVQNNGKTRAERVQVFAKRLSKQSAGSFKVVNGFLPMNLRWAHAQGGAPEIFAEGISPRMYKHCDLGHVIDPARRAEFSAESSDDADPNETILSLDLEVKPTRLSHLIKPGVYRLELSVAAANSGPVAVTLELTITGRWFSDEAQMFSDGLGVKVL